jgi:hypothetical protein
VDPAEDIAAYAALAAELATAVDRAELLGRHGLDEDSWAALEDRWLTELSRAEDEHQGDGPPPLVLQFAEAFSRAQQRGAEVLPLERYAEITRDVCSGRDIADVLKRQRVELADYLRAHRHWTERMASDEQALAAFRRMIG